MTSTSSFADSTIRQAYLLKGNGTQASISVQMPLAVELCHNTPASSSNIQEVFKLMSRHGGKVPLHLFAQALIVNGLTRR